MGSKMKKLTEKIRTIRRKRVIYRELNSHNWATKTEMQRFFSGRPDLKLKRSPK